MPTRVLHYPGSASAVTCDVADLNWLVEFLRPSFWSRRSGASEWSFELVRDGPEYRRLLDLYGGGPGRQHGVFYLDTRVEKLSALSEDDELLTLLDPTNATVCELDSRNRRVRITTSKRRLGGRITLMRFVRERAMSAALDRGWLLLHAAGFAVRGQAVLVAGRKRSGKSSLLLHTLSSRPATQLPVKDAVGRSDRAGSPVRYLSNDRTLLRFSRGRIEARGLPTIASLRTSGLSHFPHTRRLIEASGFFPALTRAEARRRSLGSARPWEGDKFTMSPSHLCQVTDARPTAAAPLRAILFPHVSQENGGIRLTRLAPPEATSALRGGLFRAGRRYQGGKLFSRFQRRGALSTHQLDDWIDAVVKNTVCYACELGLQAYENPSWFSRVSALLPS